MVEDPVESDHVRTLVLNALVATGDTSSADDADFLADDQSLALIREAYHTATTADERTVFTDIVTRAQSTDALTDEHAVDHLQKITSAVLSQLADWGIKALVDHRARVMLPARDVHLSSYGNTKNRMFLDRLSLPPDITPLVDEGGEYVSNREFSRAADSFEQAVTENTASEGMVTTRVLAALANHWEGADERAIDFVEEALHLDTDTWSARLVGLAAGHRYSERFRRGKLSAQAFLRYTIDTPPDSPVRAQIGSGEPSALTWRDLEGTESCLPIDRLEPETWIRLQLRGVLPAFPAVYGYYIGLGVIDREVFEVRDVERILLSGPETTASSETLQLERP